METPDLSNLGFAFGELLRDPATKRASGSVDFLELDPEDASFFQRMVQASTPDSRWMIAAHHPDSDRLQYLFINMSPEGMVKLSVRVANIVATKLGGE